MSHTKTPFFHFAAVTFYAVVFIAGFSVEQAAADVPGDPESYSIRDAVDAALESDPVVAARRRGLEAAELTRARTAIERAPRVTFDSGTTRLAYDWSDDAGRVTLSSDPAATYRAQAASETTVTVGVPFAITFGDDGGFTASPGVSASRGRLLDLYDADGLVRAERALAITERAAEYAGAVAGVERRVIDGIRDVANARFALASADRRLAAAERAIDRADRLGSPAPETAAYLRLTVELERAERAVTVERDRFDTVAARLSRTTGLDAELLRTLPAPTPPAALPPAFDPEAGTTYAVRIEELKAEIARLREANARQTRVSGISVGGGTSVSVEADGDGVSVTGVGLSGTVGISQPGRSVSTTISGDPIKQNVGIGVRLSLDPSARARDEITQDILRTDREAAFFWLENALRSRGDAVRGLSEQVRSLEERRVELEEDVRIAELDITEKRRAFDQGVILETELSDAEWSLTQLEHNRYLWALDRYLRVLDAEQLGLVAR